MLSSPAVIRRWAPPVLLAVYALAFGSQALGGGVLAFDDHPGQLYRVIHAITIGLAPWRWNPGWWAGYAELQYYPPGFAYTGALLHYATLGAIAPPAIYRVLLWVTFLLPGAATYALLARVLGRAWLALPGAWVALTLSAGSRSGIEEGLRWGLVAARLAWGLLPCLALALVPWVEGRARPARVTVFLLGTILLIHPAHWPAAVVLVLLAAAHGRDRWRWRHAVLVVLFGTGLAAFWLVPLVSSLQLALPLAWGDGSLGGLAAAVAARPLLVVLAVTSALTLVPSRTGALPPRARWLVGLAPALALLIVIDATLGPALGVLWLPADRLLDSFLLALVVGASLALALLAQRFPRAPRPALALAAVGLALVLSSSHRGEPSLTTWPGRDRNEWPKHGELVARLRLDALWPAIREAPPGRILFVRSGVPLDRAADWRRPHTHLTALTPVETGREILNGTFTHPSPVAGLLYTGSAANEPIRLLAEQRDGLTLFGRPLEQLGAGDFHRLAERLRVAMVVALDEDEPRLGFVRADPSFAGPERLGPFRIFRAREMRPPPHPAGPQRWTLAPSSPAGGWTPAGVAGSPRWQARHGADRLPTRRDPLGLLEIEAPPGAAAVDLVYGAGWWEWLGCAVTLASGAGLLAWPRLTRGR